MIFSGYIQVIFRISGHEYKIKMYEGNSDIDAITYITALIRRHYNDDMGTALSN